MITFKILKQFKVPLSCQSISNVGVMLTAHNKQIHFHQSKHFLTETLKLKMYVIKMKKQPSVMNLINQFPG